MNNGIKLVRRANLGVISIDKKMKICIIGNYPPPAGGRNTHIKNLAFSLLNIGHEVVVLDLASKNKYGNLPFYVKRGHKVKYTIREIMLGRFDLVHFHITSWRYIAVMGLLCRILGTKVVMTIHSFRFNYKNEALLIRFWIKLSLILSNRIISVGQNERNRISKFYNTTKMQVISPFIKNNDVRQREPLPEEIQRFISNVEKVVISVATANNQYRGDDLYGIDMCIELCSFFIKNNVDFKMVIILTKITDKEYYAKLINVIKNRKLSERLYIFVGSIDFINLLKRSSLFVRPVSSDSFGLSILESLEVGVPTVASDVCDRPAGCKVFRSRDQSEFNTLCLS